MGTQAPAFMPDSSRPSSPPDTECPLEWFRTMLDKLPAAAFIKDDAGRFVFVNERMRDASAQSVNGLVGKKSHDYLRPEFVPEILEQDRAVLEQGKTVEVVQAVPLKDGTSRDWLICKFPLSDASGRRFVAGVAIDVTERKQAQDELAQSERRFRHAFQNAAIGISVISLAGHFVQVNAALCAITGRSERELIGIPFASITHPDDLRENLDLFEKLLAGRIPSYVVEKRYLRPDGRPVWVRNSVSLTRDADGAATSVVSLTEDITQRRHNEELELERHGLQEAVRAMERVLGVVAHELRTPLASIRAMAEMLLTPGWADRKQEEDFLHRLHEEVVRMSETIDSLLEAARINSGQARWNWSTVDLGITCGMALESVRPLVNPAVELRNVVEPPDLQMAGDPEAIRRLVLNLLSNARKHTDSGSIEVRVSPRQIGAERWIELQVRDTGRGIAPAAVSKLGHAFALNSGMVGAGHISGTGLGLSICKGIADAHGGTLNVTSEIGRGTTVVALLRADLSAPASTVKDGPCLPCPSGRAAAA